jgi:hypothetical protein
VPWLIFSRIFDLRFQLPKFLPFIAINFLLNQLIRRLFVQSFKFPIHTCVLRPQPTSNQQKQHFHSCNFCASLFHLEGKTASKKNFCSSAYLGKNLNIFSAC